MAVQPVSVHLFLGGTWVSQTPLEQRVFSDDPIEITKSATLPVDPAKITLTWNNDDNRYDPDDPTSPLYGVAGRNTPLSVLVGASERQRVELSSYQPEATIDHVAGAARGRAQCATVGEGILRRLGRWTDAVRSPMYSQISSRANSVGHWPLEEGSDATQLSNTRTDAPPGSAVGVGFSDDDSPAGAASSVKMPAGARMSGWFRRVAAANAGWQFAWSFRLPAIPAPAFSTIISWTTTNGYRWWLDVDDNEYRVRVEDRAGTSLLSSTTTFGTGAEPNQWITMRCKVSASGGTVTVELAWYPQGGAYLYGVSPTFAGTTGALQNWYADASVAMTNGWLSHVFGVTTVADDLLSYGAIQSFNGYVGETAGERFKRLCDLFGVAWRFIGTASTTVPMGAQRPGKFVALLEECARTDDALIYDDVAFIRLVFHARKARYNLTVGLALTYPGDVAPVLRKVLDDALTINSVTVKNAGGGEATAVRETGPLSVLAPPLGVGEYKGGDLEINAESDAPLENRAAWELAKGTIPGARYPTVRVDLLKSPGLITAAQAVAPGDVISLTGKGPDMIRLLVVGIKEVIGHVTRTIEYACLPAAVWFPAKYDATATRYDSRATTLQAAKTTTATSWVVVFPGLADAWTTAAGSLPFDILVAGERCRVTAVSAVSGAAGAYTQTLTVTRSINGVIKAQLAGAEIHVFDVARYAL